MILRIGAIVVLLLSVLFMPFWVSVIIALAGMVYFNIFLEALAFILLSDLLYGVKENSGAIFISFAGAVLLLVLIEIFKKKVKFYN